MCGEFLPPLRERIRYCDCGCGCGPRVLTTEEEIEILEDRKKRLQREVTAIEERVEKLK